MIKEILEERKVPDLLDGADSPEKWEARRKEIFEILETEIYGRPIPKMQTVGQHLDEELICAQAGIRTSVRLFFPGAPGIFIPC